MNRREMFRRLGSVGAAAALVPAATRPAPAIAHRYGPSDILVESFRIDTTLDGETCRFGIRGPAPPLGAHVLVEIPRLHVRFVGWVKATEAHGITSFVPEYASGFRTYITATSKDGS